MSKQSSRGNAWEATRALVLRRDGWQCQYCGKPLDGSDATVDHLLAKDSGGTDDPTNLVAACRLCNSRKGTKTLTRAAWYNPRWLTRL